MPDYLTRRNGVWHFARRVPSEFSHVDRRGIVKHSTKIRVEDDRSGRRAARVAEEFNKALEAEWKALTDGKQSGDYARVRSRAMALGFEYKEQTALLAGPPEEWLKRLESVAINKAADDPAAYAAATGVIAKPVFMLSELFTKYEEATTHEVMDLSPDQLRIWRNGKIRAVKYFVEVVGDKAITSLTCDDGFKYREKWRERVVEKGLTAKSANKDIGQINRMLKAMSTLHRLGIPDIFKGLYLKGEVEKQRMPFEQCYVQKTLLAPGALDGLNEDARFIFYVLADTGLRPSEVCNLTNATIHLKVEIPYVSIVPDGRRLKTKDSERDIPLVGAALAAMKRRPNGFERYRDKSSSLSATINKFLEENNLKPTNNHTVYSLRHSFKDRLVAAEAPDSLIDNLMGHKTHKPKYGTGPSLALKLKYLQQIAFKAPFL